MARQDLNRIFLSASIPYPDRDKKFYDTADIVAIRDAVRALATVIIPKAHLVWGGHPSITPLIRFVMDKMKVDVNEHVSLYQSLFFERFFPTDNFSFENIILTPIVNNSKDESLALMRLEMMQQNDFKVGIFIGGMEGVELEFELFIKYHPDALILPIASTGAASKIIYDRLLKQNGRLENDYAYMSLFRHLLSEII
jgi:hypothetical protein